MKDGEISNDFRIFCIEEPAALSFMLIRAADALGIELHDDLGESDSGGVLLKAQELFLYGCSELDVLD